MPLYPELWRGLRELADACCDGRLVALGGGGYEPCTAPPPEGWRAIALAAGCPEPAHGWLEDRGPEPDAERDRLAARQSEEAIQLTVTALSRFFPTLA